VTQPAKLVGAGDPLQEPLFGRLVFLSRQVCILAAVSERRRRIAEASLLIQHYCFVNNLTC
jgi:hypothetical protein